MDGCIKYFFYLCFPPLGWILLIIEAIQESNRKEIVRQQKEYFDSLNPKTLGDLDKIDNMDGHTFEHFIARVLEKNGYSNVCVTKGSNDFGVDILAEKGLDTYAIQVKRQQSRISRRAVSDAVAGRDHYGCKFSMVITNNYLSESGMQFAQSTNCIIIDRNNLIKLINTGHAQNNIKKEFSFENVSADTDSLKTSLSVNNKNFTIDSKEVEKVEREKNTDIWVDIVYDPIAIDINRTDNVKNSFKNKRINDGAWEDIV